MAENVDLKSKIEQVETWIEEERCHSDILQKEIQEKSQLMHDVEEERVFHVNIYDL